jgi:hypothetical protein
LFIAEAVNLPPGLQMMSIIKRHRTVGDVKDC